MPPIPVDDGGNLRLQALLRAVCESSRSADRKIAITVNHLCRKCVLACKDFVKVIQSGQNPTVVCDDSVCVPRLGCGGHLSPRCVEGVIGKGSIVKPETRELIAVLLTNLADDLAPKIKVGRLVLVEMRTLPPVFVIVSGVEIQL